MNKVIYTAIFGQHDDLKEPLVITQGWKYVVFTDQDLTSELWEVRKVPLIENNPRLTARYYKILFHKHFTESIVFWLDASFYINTDLNEWLQRFTPPISIMKHPDRDCVYAEAAACIKNKRDKWDVISRQIEKYRDAGVPKNGGMCASGMMIRLRSKQTIEFCELWWDEIANGSIRDQIAYGYVSWKMPIVTLIDWVYGSNREFLFVPHLNAPERRVKYLSHYKRKQWMKGV